MADHKYKLVYRIERRPEGFSADEAKTLAKDGYGSCDAMLFASIIYPETGELSILFVGEDGRTNKELDDHEWFKVWTMLACRLGRSTTLSEGRRAFAQDVFEMFCAAMQAGKDADAKETT